MKEVEKNEIKRLSDRLDLIRHQMAGLSLVDSAEKYAELEKESVKLEAEIERLREVKGQMSKEAQKLMNMPARRAITKKEQADMGKLKKSVRGLVVVHPMTELGRENGPERDEVFCKTAF
ncbi:YibL family ribosome-associated protein [Enterobacter bugandensis]|uniref:YibL family ribosome-associated protein n=1 Tax=Enterobacter bugandensis TaxID=881260 RepID=UPI0021575B56|nr:YibL family ribosome-associated protein [Enterobacter bugandensis]MCR6710958.1 YibL family ribosome-associated protein [Enterobacter bugandensis]